jgi:hypothetical protein
MLVFNENGGHDQLDSPSIDDPAMAINGDQTVTIRVLGENEG